MSNIYLIHPIDENLQFLKNVIRYLSKEFPGRTNYIKLINNRLSHEECLSKIKQSTDLDLICFFCHGRTDGLLGCRYRVSYPAHRRQYDHGLLINEDNIGILRNKKIFCLACNSIEVGHTAIEAGAKVFLGFDKININNCPNIHVKSLTKFVLRSSINNALRNGIQNNITFNQLADYLKLILVLSSLS